MASDLIIKKYKHVPAPDRAAFWKIEYGGRPRQIQTCVADVAGPHFRQENLKRFVHQANGGCSRIRTYDPLIKSQLLYQLSYAPVPFESREGLSGKGAEHT